VAAPVTTTSATSPWRTVVGFTVTLNAAAGGATASTITAASTLTRAVMPRFYAPPTTVRRFLARTSPVMRRRSRSGTERRPEDG